MCIFYSINWYIDVKQLLCFLSKMGITIEARMLNFNSIGIVKRTVCIGSRNDLLLINSRGTRIAKGGGSDVERNAE